MLDTEDLNFSAINGLRRELQDGVFDLADPESLAALLSDFAPRLSLRAAYAGDADNLSYDAATDYLVFSRPVLMLTERPDGAKEVLSRLSEGVDEGAEVPRHLTDLLCGIEEAAGAQNAFEVECEPVGAAERIARSGGESETELLSLPANGEQLEIARRMANHPAVLVQGPPGTGKTHTIANLLGNLLASGKRVLVTSETDKALTVLRGKLPEALQPLCVSMFEERGKSAAAAVQEAVAGICDRVGRAEYSVANLIKEERRLEAERRASAQALAQLREAAYAVRCSETARVAHEGRSLTREFWRIL